MYYCEDCKSYFEDPKIEFFQDVETWNQSHKFLCPICNGDDFEEAIKCESCNQHTNKSESVNGICTECQLKIQKQAREFFEKFNEQEQEFILEFLNEI